MRRTGLLLISETCYIKSLWDLSCSNSNQWEFCLLYSRFGAPFWSQTMCHHHEHPGDTLILLAGLVNITQKEISIKPAMVSLEKTEELSNCSFFKMGPVLPLGNSEIQGHPTCLRHSRMVLLTMSNCHLLSYGEFPLRKMIPLHHLNTESTLGWLWWRRPQETLGLVYFEDVKKASVLPLLPQIMKIMCISYS